MKKILLPRAEKADRIRDIISIYLCHTFVKCNAFILPHVIDVNRRQRKRDLVMSYPNADVFSLLFLCRYQRTLSHCSIYYREKVCHTTHSRQLSWVYAAHSETGPLKHSPGSTFFPGTNTGGPSLVKTERVSLDCFMEPDNEISAVFRSLGCPQELPSDPTIVA